MDFIFYNEDKKTINKLDVNSYKFLLDSPDNSLAKPEKVNLILEVSGDLKDDDFSTLEKLTNWALTSSKSASAYRKSEFMDIEGDVIKRKYTFSHAFVLDFEEYQEPDEGADGNGVKKFSLRIKQKYDKIDGFTVQSDIAMENPEDEEN